MTPEVPGVKKSRCGVSEPEVRGGTGGISEANSRTPRTDRGLGPLRVGAAGLKFGFVEGEHEVEGLTLGLRFGVRRGRARGEEGKEGLVWTPGGAEPKRLCPEQGEGIGRLAEREFI